MKVVRKPIELDAMQYLGPCPSMVFIEFISKLRLCDGEFFSSETTKRHEHSWETGEIKKPNFILISEEPTVLYATSGKYKREVEPGSWIVINRHKKIDLYADKEFKELFKVETSAC